MTTTQSAAYSRFRSNLARLGHPNWMAKPDTWLWRRPDRATQGFGGSWRDSPGLANLLWLSMDLDHPPREYDAASNSLFTMILVFSGSSKIGAVPLLDAAGLHTLQQFHDMLPKTAPAGGNALEETYPLLKLLAARRLRNENT